MNIRRHPVMATFTGCLYLTAFNVAGSVSWADAFVGFGLGMYASWLFTKAPGPVCPGKGDANG